MWVRPRELCRVYGRSMIERARPGGCNEGQHPPRIRPRPLVRRRGAAERGGALMNIEVKPAEFWKVASGTTLETCPTALDIVAIDQEPLPLVLRHAGDLHPGPRLIPFDPYYDPKFVDLEIA